jgi:hypothetical protein
MGSPEYIVTGLADSTHAFLCRREGQGEYGSVYKQIAEGDFVELAKLARALNSAKDALPVGPEDVVTEAVAPEDIETGDHVLIEMIVKRVSVNEQHNLSHLQAVPLAEGLWMLGDQHAWTWGWSMHGGKKLERIVRD